MMNIFSTALSQDGGGGGGANNAAPPLPTNNAPLSPVRASRVTHDGPDDGGVEVSPSFPDLAMSGSTVTESRRGAASPVPAEVDPAVAAAAAVGRGGSPPKRAPAPHFFECDYDVNPTPLYKALESRRWDEALRVLREEAPPGRETSAAPSSSSSSETATANSNNNNSGTNNNHHVPASGPEQAASWVVRKERDGKLRWRMLPVHASIIFRAPAIVVESLLGAAPTCAQHKDDQGMLPLHLAFRNDADDDIIDGLLADYPAGIEVKDRKGRVPLLCGVSRGNAYRWRLLSTYTALAVQGERRRLADHTNAEHEKALEMERATHRLAIRRLEEQHARKMKESEDMIASVVGEVTKIRVRSDELQSDLLARDQRDKDLAKELEALQREKKLYQQKILETEKEVGDASSLTVGLLQKFNKMCADEKKLVHRIEESRSKQSFDGPDDQGPIAAGVGVLPTTDEEGGKPSVHHITHTVNQISDLLEETRSTLNAEIADKKYLQQKLEDTIEKQVELTRELNITKAELERAEDENEQLQNDLDEAKRLADRTMVDRASHDHSTRERTRRLESASRSLETLVAAIAKQKTDVEASFAVRERMLQAIAKQEQDMMRAATQKDDLVQMVNLVRENISGVLSQPAVKDASDPTKTVSFG